VKFVSNTFLKSISTNRNKVDCQKFYQEQKKKISKDGSKAKATEFAISLGQNLVEMGNYKDAIRIFTFTVSVLQTDTTSVDSNEKLFILNNSIGIIYKNLGDNKQAMEKYLQAFRIARSMKWQSGIAKSYNNLAELYYEQGNLDKTKMMLKEASQINFKIGNKSDLEINYNNLGIICYEQKRYNESMNYYNKAFALLDPKDVFSRAALFTNISLIYKSRKQYKQASGYLKKAVALHYITHNDQNILLATRDLAEIQALAGETEEALRLSDKAIALSKKLNIPIETAETYRTLTDVLLIVGDTVKAMRYILNFETINDSIRQVRDKESLNKLLSVYEVEMLKYKNKELEQLHKIKELTIGRQRLILAGAGVILVLLILLLFFLSKKIKSDQVKNRLMALHKELLLENERQLFEKNLKEKELEIDFKNRTLTSYTLNQVSGNEFNQRILHKLESLQNSVSDKSANQNKKDISEIIRDIYHYSNNHVSEEFKAYFDSVHPTFFENILKANPGLTATELRLCGFLRLGLTTKEIAALTFREIRSVESARNRLRKKLELDLDENLNNYFVRL